MNNPNGSVTKAEFAQFEKRIVFRLIRLEKKMDKLNDKVVYIYGGIAGISVVVTLITQFIWNVI